MQLRVFILMLALISCGKPENEKFECFMISPGPFQIIANDVPVSLEVSVSHDVSHVEFYFDNELIADKSGTPEVFTWAPHGCEGGKHTLKVKVYPYDYETETITIPLKIKYFRGEKTQGGTIFSLDDTGFHGLAVSSTDLIFKNKMDLHWGVTQFIGATDSTNGKSNTELLANSGILNDYFWNQFKYESDWYVPSKSEMLVLLDFVTTSGDDLSMSNTYWTSTECCRANACAVDFVNHNTLVTLKEDSLFRVRLIRKF